MLVSKSWKHWCKDQNLKPEYERGKGLTNWYHLKGRGYHWRITCNATFQIGDTYEDFDRWALCDLEEFPIPRSLEEFRETVKKLLAAKTKTAI